MKHLSRYQPFYCEENVWWLARSPELAERKRWAVFVSNPDRTCALWHQRLASEPDEPVIWDYHVVLFVLGAEGPEVWDLDSQLPAPSPALDWLDATFPAPTQRRFRPRFRVVDAAELSAHFASDRRHMVDSKGIWQAEPPPWPPIVSPTGAIHTLEAFIEVRMGGPGVVHDLVGFRRWARSLVTSAG